MKPLSWLRGQDRKPHKLETAVGAVLSRHLPVEYRAPVATRFAEIQFGLEVANRHIADPRIEKARAFVDGVLNALGDVE